MLVNLLAWVYISALCLAWGNMAMRGLMRLAFADSKRTVIETPLVLLAGLSVTGCIVLYASLFLPVNGVVHGIVLVPVILFYLRSQNRKVAIMQLRSLFAGYSRIDYALPCAGLLVLLLISSYRIHHPDTLNYHAQIIKWMESYKAVPGLAQLKNEFGLQGMWFGLQALFRFDFLYANNCLFVNGCVAGWLVLFISGKLAQTKKAPGAAWLGWLLLFAFVWISWGLLRLTAASASPDLVTALFCWAAFYAYLKAGEEGADSENYLLLAVVFSVSAAVTKLSGMYMLLLVAVLVVGAAVRGNWRVMIAGISVSILLLMPFLARNLITSGYLLYPSHFPDWVTAEWKLSEPRVTQFEQYITAYARLAVDDPSAAGHISDMPLATWAPLWFKHLELADKCFLLALAASFVLDLIFLKRFIQSLKGPWIVIYAIALTAVIIWFMKAPDPRFGMGYLIPLLYLQSRPFNDRLSFQRPRYAPMVKAAQFCCIAALIVYGGYRMVHFFKKENLLFPDGVEKAGYLREICNGIIIYRPLNNEPNGFTPVPCIPGGCDTATWRTGNVADGFK